MISCLDQLLPWQPLAWQLLACSLLYGGISHPFLGTGDNFLLPIGLGLGILTPVHVVLPWFHPAHHHISPSDYHLFHKTVAANPPTAVAPHAHRG